MSGARLLSDRARHASTVGTGRSEVHEAGVEVVPVKRYWPGKAPQWAEEGLGEGHVAGVGEARQPDVGAAAHAQPPMPAPPTLGERERRAPQVLARAAPRGREEAEEEEEESSEDEDELEARRARARARMRQQEGQEGPGARGRATSAMPLAPGSVEESGSESGSEPGSESGESSSGEEEESSEDMDGPARPGGPLLRPMFVRKSDRETVRAQELEEAAAEEEERKRVNKLAERRKETLDLVVQSVQLEERAEEQGARQDMPDDDDEADEEEAYEAWKLRELRRMKRERDAVRAVERERAEVERRRGLSEAERLREDEARAAASRAGKEEQVQRNFLQKYYHKGAFFQAEDEAGNPVLGDIMKRDFGAATGGDKGVDKASLPAPMQVKKFGFRSQSKWTHLTAEDTTDRDTLLGGRQRDHLHRQRGRDEFRKPGSGSASKRPRHHDHP